MESCVIQCLVTVRNWQIQTKMIVTNFYFTNLSSITCYSLVLLYTHSSDSDWVFSLNYSYLLIKLFMDHNGRKKRSRFLILNTVKTRFYNRILHFNHTFFYPLTYTSPPSPLNSHTYITRLIWSPLSLQNAASALTTSNTKKNWF